MDSEIVGIHEYVRIDFLLEAIVFSTKHKQKSVKFGCCPGLPRFGPSAVLQWASSEKMGKVDIGQAVCVGLAWSWHLKEPPPQIGVFLGGGEGNLKSFKNENHWSEAVLLFRARLGHRQSLRHCLSYESKGFIISFFFFQKRKSY